MHLRVLIRSALIPGDYKTRIAAQGFSSAEVPTTVLLGNTATVNASLQIGNEKDVVEVRSSALQVNTDIGGFAVEIRSFLAHP